jgi:hypothetical protein
MPKVLIEAFHDDGMNQFEARPDVTYGSSRERSRSWPVHGLAC